MSALDARERWKNWHECSKFDKELLLKVFEAEKQIAKPGSYHRKCFTCSHCRHLLDPASLTAGDTSLLCRPWHTR